MREVVADRSPKKSMRFLMPRDRQASSILSATERCVSASSNIIHAAGASSMGSVVSCSYADIGLKISSVCILPRTSRRILRPHHPLHLARFESNPGACLRHPYATSSAQLQWNPSQVEAHNDRTTHRVGVSNIWERTLAGPDGVNRKQPAGQLSIWKEGEEVRHETVVVGTMVTIAGVVYEVVVIDCPQSGPGSIALLRVKTN